MSDDDLREDMFYDYGRNRPLVIGSRGAVLVQPPMHCLLYRSEVMVQVPEA